MINLNQKLSDHFSLWECIRSETASRHGIDNTPPPEKVIKIIYFCNSILEPIRNFYNVPFRPNSIYRCYELGLKIYEKENETEEDIKKKKYKANHSQHYFAEAGDIEVPGVSNYDLAVWVKNHLEFDQLILECYKIGQPSSGWVHISRKRQGNRMQVKTWTGKQWIPGLIK